MQKRLLASIEKILLLEPLKNGSEVVEKASLSNYHQVIFEKGLFKLGDVCVFFKENSKLPEIKVFESLRSNKFLVTKEIIGGEISEGYCFPLSILPKDIKIELGRDVTKTLNVRFYDPYPENQKKALIEKKLAERKFSKRKAIAKGLISKIKMAFSGITLDDGLSLREARKIDDDYSIGHCPKVRVLDEIEDWQKVTDEDLKTYGDSLPCFSDEKGRTFYVPAYMCFGLREFIKTGQTPCLCFALYGILPPLGMDEFLCGWLKSDEILFLNKEQTLIVKHYITFFSQDLTLELERQAKIFVNDLSQYLVKNLPQKKSRFINKPQIKERTGTK